MTSRHWLAALGLLLASTANVALASPPWQKVAISKKIDADPEKAYPLTEKQGPWVIMAITFSPKAKETADAYAQAQELVIELRSHYKLDAYVYEIVQDL